MLFIIKKIMTPFLLPPGLFILILVVCSVWSCRSGKRHLLRFFLPAAGIIWLFSIGPIADALTRPLESAYPIPQTPQADVIIMLGGGIHAFAPDLTGTGTPGPATMERMVTAARLHRQLKAPIIISGGSVYGDRPSVARLTRRFLIDLGIPDDQIISEDQSRDTYENALFSKKLCTQHGFSQPLVVTSANHMRRSMLSFERVGLQVTPFPCALTTWPDKTIYLYSFLPSDEALAATASALHEWIGLLFYQLAYS
jgi:uncharacterized SAM-binding protein YcdF (DUF218 family)